MFRLTIYLVKETITNLEDVVTEKYKDEVNEIEIKKSKDSILVFKEPESLTPDWYKYLKPRVDESLLKKTMSSPSALLVCKFEDRIFAISFGYGRYCLDETKVVPDFGLKVCLNTLTGEEIKTVDKKTMEKLALHTRQQAVIPINFNTFDIELDRDLIKSVDGHSDQDFGKYFKGATALTIVTEKSIEGLFELCETLLTTYRKNKYKNEFGWIDNVKIVVDPELTTDLDGTLLKKILDDDASNCFIGVPEMVDDSQIKFYKISGIRNGSEYRLFPSLDIYISTLKAKKQRSKNPEEKQITLDDFSKDYVVAYNWDAKASEINKWSIYRCLHAELERNKKVYKLLDGNWYEIDKDYLDEIETKIKNIPEYNSALIDMEIGKREEDYNEALSLHLNAANLDQDFIQIEGRSKFEFCDVFTKSKDIMHVKKYSGAASISHLLYQAHVSGSMFANDSEVREELAKKATIKKLQFQTKVNPPTFKTSDYKIILIIGAKKKEKLNKLLSFFCKISMAHKYRVLTNMGFEVAHKVVEIK